MRRMKPLSLALASLALSAATAVEAGLPTAGDNSNGQPSHASHGKKTKAKKAHLCADCAARLTASGPIPASAPCTACGDAANAMSAPTMMAPVVMAGSAPGYAVIGDGAPAPLMTVSGPGSSGAPGYAIVGGQVASSEPVPIGVMRTNYNNDSQAGSLGASVDIMHGQGQGHGAGPGMGMGMPGGGMDPRFANAPYAKASEMPGSLYNPQVKHRSMLSRLLLPDFGRRAAEMEARKRESHAMTSYGPGSAPTELPASMVYPGGGGR